MKGPIRVAHIIGKWVGGGVESVVMNYYRFIDRNKIQFDFICDSDSTNIPYDEIEALGGKVIIVPPYQKVFKYHKELKRVLKEGNYKIVHSHINTLSVFSLCAAKAAGVPVRIAHSHATSNKKEIGRHILKSILKIFSLRYSTDYFSCSIYAGQWIFGKKIIESDHFYLMNNAIDIDKFKYSEEKRNSIRKELGISKDEIVIGQIGRLVKTKNHLFTLDLFACLKKEDLKMRLVFIGSGPLEKQIKKTCYDRKLEVIFLGQKQYIHEYYNALDILLLPSLYEGLGMVLIESQCSNLKCICSSNVSKEADITHQLNYLPLDINKWKRLIKNIIIKNKLIRKTNSELLSREGYNIRKECIKLENKYFELFRRC